MKFNFTITSAPRRRPLWAATGLFALALAGLGSCTPDAGQSSSGAGVVALFNPSASPAVVPSPNDLVRVNGKLQIPLDPAEMTNGALAAFNGYLRTLDAYPPDSTPGTTFSGMLDPAAMLSEGVVIYDATALPLTPVATATPVIDSTGMRLSINTPTSWTHGHTYAVALFSWQQSGDVHGLKGADGKPVLADTAFAYLRSTTPIYAKCQDPTNSACTCTVLSDSTCRSVVDGLTDAQAQQLEAARLGLKPLLDAMLSLTGRNRSDLVLAWSFTISQRTFATFDLTRSQIPFPSNLLLSNMGMGAPNAPANVNLPILPTDPPATQALKMGLNTLDGFSTTGSVQFPIDAPLVNGAPMDINAATVIPGMTAFLVNLLSPTRQPTFTAQPLEAILPQTSQMGFAGQIRVTPARPLDSDYATYAAVLTTNIIDASGAPIVQPPAMVLLTQSSPLVTSDGKSAISAIPLAQAQQLEALRTALAPLVASLSASGIQPSTIAALTAYRTQSILAPLQTLLAGMTKLAPLIPSQVTITKVALPPFPAAPPLGAVAAVVHGTMSVRRVVDLEGAFDTTRLTNLATTNDTIPFVLTVPMKAAAPATGAPVVIAQHGLTRWRGDTLSIANTLATQGLAMIAIDVIYHGARVVCLSTADCASAATPCVQPAPINGVPQAGTCMNGAYLPAPGATAVMPGIPDVLPNTALPNRDFTNLTNPFAQRDNFRQHVLDLFQLVRVIQDSTAMGLSTQVAGMVAGLPALDTTKIGYVGQSLGSILGTSFLALSPSVNLGVLSVGGGDLVDMFTDPNSTLGGATSLGIPPGTPAYYSVLENFRWIMDPADPINLARYVRSPGAAQIAGRTPAKVILQESGNDTVILNKYTLALGTELGLPVDANQHLEGINQEGSATPTLKTTFFAGADHGVIFDFTNPALTIAAQTQAAAYLATGLQGAPPTVQ